MKNLWDLIDVVKTKKRIVRAVIYKIVVKKKGKTLTFSRTKKHTLWQHRKYMVTVDSQEIYIPSLNIYNKCSTA